MPQAPTQLPVVVIGAGPVGLAAAVCVRLAELQQQRISSNGG